MDRYAFTAPARVKSLLVPVCGSKSAEFEASVELIKSCLEVRLLDISPNPQLRLFDPETFPQGKLLLDFDTVYSDPDNFFLHDFEPFRKTFIVLGIAQQANNTNSFDLALEELRSRYPSSIFCAIVVFGHSGPPQSRSSSDVFYHSGSFASLPTIICDIGRLFLGLLDTYASSYPNITLRSPVSIADSHVLVSQSILRAQKRISSGSSSFSATFIQTPTPSNTPGSMSSASVAQSVSPAPDPKSRAKLRQAGRQAKLLGNFYLLSGQYLKALQSLLDSLVHLKKSEDSLWLGSALESVGVCIVLLRASNTPFSVPVQIFASILQVSKQKVASFSSSMADLGSPRVSMDQTTPSSARSSISSSFRVSANPQHHTASPRSSIGSIFNPTESTSSQTDECIVLISNRSQILYQLSASDYDDIVPDVVYIESILRSINFLIYSAPDTLPNPNRREILRRIDHISSMKLSSLCVEVQCRVYCALGTVYSELKMFRKRGFILRALILALLAHLDVDSAPTSPHAFAKHLPIKIRPLFDSLLDLYGLGSAPESDAQAAASHAQGEWTSVQTQLLKIFIKFLDFTKDFDYLLKICSLLLVRLGHCLTPVDQIKVKDKIEAILNYSALNNLNLSTPYWDPFMLRGVQIVPLRVQDTIVMRQDQTDKPLTSNLDVFDPYNRPKTETLAREKMLVQGQGHVLRLLMQNPYSFDVEINYIEVSTDKESVKVETVQNSWRKVVSEPGTNIYPTYRKPDLRTTSTTPSIIQASSTVTRPGILTLTKDSIETVTLTIKPLEPGQLKINGIVCEIGGCERQLFRIIDHEIKMTSVKSKSVTKREPSLDIMASLESNLRTSNINDRATFTDLDLMVIPKQPTLVVSKSLINDGSCMILEGQRFRFSVEYTNTSDEPINYLSFSFWDSGIDYFTKQLNSSVNLPPNEVYELEWQMLENKTFSVLNKLDISCNHKVIAPASSITIEYEVVGKRLVRDLRIILAYENRAKESPQGYLKQVHVPFSMTVTPSIEILGYNFMPLSSSFVVSDKVGCTALDSVRNYFERGANLKKPDNYCLLILDVQNSHWESLETLIVYESEADDIFSVDIHLGPGENTRVFLPMRRISLSQVDLTKAIPSLRNKQFIKNTLMTESEISIMHEQFWIRQHILEHLQGSWSCIKGNRKGLIDFRSLKVSSAASNIVWCDNISIEMHIRKDGDPSSRIESRDSYFHLERDEYYVLSYTISNVTKQKVSGMVRHIPLSINGFGAGPTALQLVDGKILVNGVLQFPIGGGGIEPQSSVTLDMAFVVLERGEYEWGLIFDQTLNTNKYHIPREPLMIMAT